MRRAFRFSTCARFAIAAFVASSGIAHAAAPAYDEAVRTSQYITVRDGTRLAVDIYRPSLAGKVAADSLPVILEASLFAIRSRAAFGKLDGYLMDVLRHGYVIAVLETRGHGASFGQMSPARVESAEDYWDLYDAIEWLARQSWSNGNIGMAGCSNAGLTQYRAASVMPPHLKAIMPTSAPVDWATIGSVNGVTSHAFMEWRESGMAPALVDEDRDGALGAAATMQQRIGGEVRFTRPFRDKAITLPGVHALPTQWWNFLPSFAVAKTPVFQYAGWRDIFVDQSLTLYRNLAIQGVPQQLIIGPWYHCEWYRSSLTNAGAEAVRWYDYWLKGIGPQLSDEAPIRYYVVGAPEGRQWQTAERWPLPNTNLEEYFLHEQGDLKTQSPKGSEGSDRYEVDYAQTTAKMVTRWPQGTRWRDLDNPGLLPIPTADVDSRSLIYTSEPLSRDVELTGFPLITLWVASSAEDQDFFVYLEEVDDQGRATLLTEGAIRASNRATRTPPFDNEGLPWHAGYEADQQNLRRGVPTKLESALFPLSNYLRKGHRLRIAVNSFDAGAWDSPVVSPPPAVSLYRDAQRPSSIRLPFIRH